MKVELSKKVKGALIAAAIAGAPLYMSENAYAAETNIVETNTEDDFKYSSDFDNLEEAETKEQEVIESHSNDYENIESKITEETEVISTEEILVSEESNTEEDKYTDLTKEEAENKKAELEHDTKEETVEVTIKEYAVDTEEDEEYSNEKVTETKEEAESFIKEETEKLEKEGYHDITSSIEEKTEEVTEYESDGVTPKTEVKTDSEGNAVLIDVYDREGNVVGMVPADKSGNPSITEIYDEEGNLLDLDKTDSNGVKLYTWKIAKNSGGQTLYLDSKGNITTEEFTITKEVIGEEECSKDDNYTRTEESTEKCSKDDEGARLIAGSGEEIEIVSSIYVDDETLAKIKEILGDFGLTASEVAINEAQTNINAGMITKSGNQIGVHGDIIYDDIYGVDTQGNVVRIEDMKNNVKLGLKGNITKIIIGSEALKNQLELKEQVKYNASFEIDSEENASVKDIRKKVENLSEELSKANNYLFADDFDINNPTLQNIISVYNSSLKTGEKKFEDMTTNEKNAFLYRFGYCTVESVNLERYTGEGGLHTKQELDFTKVTNQSNAEFDVVYTTVGLINNWNNTTSSIGTCDQDGKLFIKMNENQTVVINVDTSNKKSIDLMKFTVIVTDKDGKTTTYDGTQGDGKLISQQIVFNFGDYSGTINISGSIFGSIIAPNATVNMKSTSAGQIICKKFNDKGGELHYTGTSVKKEIIKVNEEYERDVIKYFKEIEQENKESNTPLFEIEAKDTIIKTKEVVSYNATISGLKDILENKYSLDVKTTKREYSEKENTKTTYHLVVTGDKKVIFTNDPPVEEETEEYSDPSIVQLAYQQYEDQVYEIPKTGDETDKLLYEYLAFITMSGAGYAIYDNKKKRQKVLTKK